jgi:hypothetical protein
MTQRSMQSRSRAAFLAMASLGLMFPHLSCGEGGLHKVNHVIIIMQENHSFDNYFGALALAATTLLPAVRKTTTAVSMDSPASSTPAATLSARTATRMKTARSSRFFRTHAAASSRTSTTHGSQPIAKPTSITPTTVSRISSLTARAHQ